jgi:hypothetical protein
MPGGAARFAPPPFSRGRGAKSPPLPGRGRGLKARLDERMKAQPGHGARGLADLLRNPRRQSPIRSTERQTGLTPTRGRSRGQRTRSVLRVERYLRSLPEPQRAASSIPSGARQREHGSRRPKGRAGRASAPAGRQDLYRAPPPPPQGQGAAHRARAAPAVRVGRARAPDRRGLGAQGSPPLDISSGRQAEAEQRLDHPFSPRSTGHSCPPSPRSPKASGSGAPSCRSYIDEPTTHGCAERVINKVKLIKRRAYGPPGFDGFRDRVLSACASTGPHGAPARSTRTAFSTRLDTFHRQTPTHRRRALDVTDNWPSTRTFIPVGRLSGAASGL